MSISLEEHYMAEGLRERHGAQAKSSQTNEANSTEVVGEDGSGHVAKEKKTFGRTPDGTGEQCNSP